MGSCRRKTSLNDMSDSVRARPNDCNRSCMIWSKWSLFFAYNFMNRSYLPVVKWHSTTFLEFIDYVVELGWIVKEKSDIGTCVISYSRRFD